MAGLAMVMAILGVVSVILEEWLLVRKIIEGSGFPIGSSGEAHCRVAIVAQRITRLISEDGWLLSASGSSLSFLIPLKGCPDS